MDIKDVKTNELVEKYNDLKIHDKTEIALEPLEICDYLNIEPGYTLKKIIEELEDEIINNKLQNDEESIKIYLNKYKK